MENADTLENKLIEETNKGYIDLSKWMIGLATGTIIFTVRLIRVGTPLYLINVLIYGLGFLVLSVISGVVFVRLRIDALFYELLQVRTAGDIVILKQDEPDKEIEYGKKKRKVKDILQEWIHINKVAKWKYETINKFVVFFLPVQQWSFFLGLIIISIFGVCVLLWK
jgi:hypothetical protein